MNALVWGMLIGFSLLAAGVFLAVRLRRPGQKPELLRYKCLRCKQRIAYRKDQVGRKAMCPNCFYSFVYPGETAPQEPPPAR